MAAATLSKEAGWDAIGLKFWWLGRKSAKPAPRTITWFVRPLTAADRCLVVGGTSVGLIRAAAATGAGVTVAEFSRRICMELRPLVPETVAIVHCDILSVAPAWEEAFTVILTDTLINRFDQKEAERFQGQAARILSLGGQVRTTVKIGLYKMDRVLLEVATMRGVPISFWDPVTRTIDFTKVGSILEQGLVRHGNIGRDDLLTWYRHRGREKRYEIQDLVTLFNRVPWGKPIVQPDPPYPDRVRITVAKVDGVEREPHGKGS